MPRLTDQAHQSRVSRKAFEDTLSVLGEAGRRAILKELESRYLYSGHSDYLEADAVIKCLEEYFGVDSTQLIMSQVSIKTSPP